MDKVAAGVDQSWQSIKSEEIFGASKAPQDTLSLDFKNYPENCISFFYSKNNSSNGAKSDKHMKK